MAITIFDYIKSVLGDKPEYTGADFDRCGVAMLGGCQTCHATLAPFNAYPSASGYWRCAGCIGDDGFATVTDFINAEFNRCPGCGTLDSIYETPVTRGYTIGTYALVCGQCGMTWTGPA